ncbi:MULTISPECIES: iron-siderophore ABC transporter substrate-binding protein [Pseudonocardia]|uniref:ABC transporter substrate-binding protein n=2 Tax=Pseudonocardia TaxID=1847 RepID=A0ABQ0RWA8_9PSEU|nr:MULTISPECIES: iron-siderophore ABC transporter substrate-binding protein [Pseudonocardia]OSY39688.1 putative ABC transporter substrate-binding lipoprotein YhfQ precursor [Pseudonocardia autotrophica]TDN72817.1 iron complex transport system substrate-binding protein [Pseudonocardia autotrophica]BBG03535.1 ABC transporter substrate-binding protein [Pseudonocardia autotrophica]GEC24955.1 ABC transporter substrate-binding protein [Pseudonocardia saturnea]
MPVVVPQSTVTRRGVLAGAAGLFLLTACGGTDRPAAPGSGAATGGFPVTIPHALGETVLPERPQRVVTLSAANADVALALGVVPVAIPRTVYGGDAEGVLPWVRDAVEASGGEFPQVIGTDDLAAIPLEQVAAARPDLILATYSGLTRPEYDQLSAIAPTVAYPDAPYSTGWQDQTRIAGDALGEPERAARLIEETRALLGGAVERFPQLAGRTFVYSGGMDAGSLGVFRAGDVRVQLVTDMGLTLAPYVEENAPGGDEVYYTVSPELVSGVESDLLIAFFATPEEEQAFRATPGVDLIPAMAAGGFAPVVGADRVVASSAPSVLSIPWVLDSYLPILGEAAARATT